MLKNNRKCSKMLENGGAPQPPNRRNFVKNRQNFVLVPFAKFLIVPVDLLRTAIDYFVLP